MIAVSSRCAERQVSVFFFRVGEHHGQIYLCCPRFAWFTNHCSWLDSMPSLVFDAVDGAISMHPVRPLNLPVVGVRKRNAFTVVVVSHGADTTSLYGFLAPGLWIVDHCSSLKNVSISYQTG